MRWKSVKRVLLWLVVILLLFPLSGQAQIPPETVPETRSLTCENAQNLKSLINCIRDYLPKRNTEIYIAPDPQVFPVWSQLIEQMLSGDCSEIQIPPEFAAFYEIRSFFDNDTGQTYCLLMETGDVNGDNRVDHGWGTYIVNPDYDHDLIIQVPHPWDDLDTEQQGIQVFQDIGARIFMMAGTSRFARAAMSSCQPEHHLSDVCHNRDTIFQATFMQIMDHYQHTGTDYQVLQFHGMAEDICPGVDVFMTHGVSTPPLTTDPVYQLKTEMEARHPDWVIRVPGEEPPCDYYGSTNIQGRTCNGVPNDVVCDTYASSYSSRFIHIEQNPEMREPEYWIDAIDAFLAYRPLPSTGAVSLTILLIVISALIIRLK